MGLEMYQVVLAAFVIALIIGFIGIMILRGQLKSVAIATEANNYIVDGSFVLTDEQDIYVCKKVDRTEKPKQNQQQ